MVYFPGLSSHRGGTSATYKMAGDTWALTTKAKQKAEDLTKQLATSSTYITAVRHARHTMIITGYDDNAVSQDEDGASHVGMLILRNSWGSDAGNHGDFYMNYDYFNALAYGAIEIIPLKSS
jgi:C1A family cysteine protease